VSAPQETMQDAQPSQVDRSTQAVIRQDGLEQLSRDIAELTAGPSEGTPKAETAAERKIVPLPGSQKGDGGNNATLGKARAKDDAKKQEKGPSQATLMSQMARARFDLGVTSEGIPFAVRKDGAPVALMFRGGKKSLRAELSNLYAGACGGTVPGSGGVSDALLQLEGAAQQAEPTDLPLRVTRNEQAILLDLGYEDGRSVKVTPNGWEITTKPGVIWRRTALTGSLPVPVRGGSLDELWSLTNIAIEDRPLILAWLVAALMADIPHPVLLLTGVQGTSKTTTARLLAELIDASPAPLRTVPKDVHDWAVSISGSWVVAIDNISSIPSWLADAICRAVTGDALVTRRLYSDDGLAVLAFRRALIITSIDTGAMRGDLADRLLTGELNLIDPASRREEREVRAAIEVARPRLLGALLDLTAGVMAALPKVQLDELPRMADFGKVLAAVDSILGTNGMARYSGQSETLFADVVEGDEVARAIREFIAGQETGEWSGTASELLEKITPDHPTKWWPGNGRALSGRLRNAAVALASTGVLVDNHRSNGVRHMTLSLLTVPQTAETVPQKCRKNGKRAANEMACGTVSEADAEIKRDPRLVNSAASAANRPPLSGYEQKWGKIADLEWLLEEGA
jgi:hypothetical protein